MPGPTLESGKMTATETGRFGPYGGRYVPETLMHALEELAAVYDAARGDKRFWAELDELLKNYVALRFSSSAKT